MMARGIQGAHRIARHLWRMCFALLLAVHLALYRSGTGVSGAAAQFRPAADPCAFSVVAHVLLAGARVVHEMVSTRLSTGSSRRFCSASQSA